MIDGYGVFSPNDTLPRWDKVELPFYGYVGLANATMFKVYLSRINKISTPYFEGGRGERLLVGIERVGCFGFPWGDWLHINYVAEKLNLGKADAGNIADLLNAVMGKLENKPEQGSYFEFSPAGSQL